VLFDTVLTRPAARARPGFRYDRGRFPRAGPSLGWHPVPVRIGDGLKRWTEARRPLSFGSQRCGNHHNFLGPFVGHNDAPGIAVPPPKGSHYYFGLTPSRVVIGQELASLVRDQLAAFRPAFKMEKIPRHEVTIQLAPVLPPVRRCFTTSPPAPAASLGCPGSSP
jgi:hypothetical protein